MFKMLSQEIEIILKIPIFISITFFDTSFFMEKGEKEGKKHKHFFMKFSIIRIIMFEWRIKLIFVVIIVLNDGKNTMKRIQFVSQK